MNTATDFTHTPTLTMIKKVGNTRARFAARGRGGYDCRKLAIELSYHRNGRDGVIHVVADTCNDARALYAATRATIRAGHLTWATMTVIKDARDVVWSGAVSA